MTIMRVGDAAIRVGDVHQRGRQQHPLDDGYMSILSRGLHTIKHVTDDCEGSQSVQTILNAN